MTPSAGSDRSRTMSFSTKPVLNDLFHRHADVSLDFIVVGGSIGGLACAYNLKQAGHNVRVLERSRGPGNISTGIRVPPNMTKIFMHWGLGERLERTGVRCPYIEMLDSADGSFLSSLVFHEEVMKELQAEQYGLTYSDLHSMVYDITAASGVQIDYNAEVVDVDVSEPSVLLASGERLRTDLIVGADGATSIVREKMVGRKEDHKEGPFTGHTCTVPVSEMKKDPELQTLLEPKGVWKVWMGEGSCVVTYLVSPDDYAIHMIAFTPNAEHDWETLMDLAPVAAKYNDYEEKVRRLLRLGTHALRTRHIMQEPLKEWFSNDGHVVLLGDAAHNLNPGTTHGSALAIEDAAVLGSLFSRLRSRNTDEIIRLLSAYQEIREDRCAEIMRTEYETAAFSTLPKTDPLREERDAGFAASRQMKVLDWENLEDPMLQRRWDEFKGPFGYEAYDAADDWWVDWGAIRERMAASSMADEDTAGSSNIGVSRISSSSS